MAHSLARWLRRRLTPRTQRPANLVISRTDAGPYLYRWFVIPQNRWLNVYLHHFIRGDEDKALHDHPWANLSFVLHGSYYEHTVRAGGVHERRLLTEGSLLFRWPRQAHLVELPEGTSCLSLFITGPKVRSWGFHCPNGWVPWRRFVDPTNSGAVGPGCDALAPTEGA